jgi:hypothetical protein
MNGGRESRRPRPALGCSAIDDDNDFNEIAWRHIPEVSNLHTRRRENLGYYLLFPVNLDFTP